MKNQCSIDICHIYNLIFCASYVKINANSSNAIVFITILHSYIWRHCCRGLLTNTFLLETELSSKVKQVESFQPLKYDFNDPNCLNHHRSIFINKDAIYDWRYKFSKVQSWQGNSRQVWKGKYVAGRKENYHHKKFTALGGNLFFNNALAQKKMWGWYHLTFVIKCCISNFYRTGLITALPCVSLDQTSCEGGVSETL